MLELFLVISDDALREAVLEQFQSPASKPTVCANIAAFLANAQSQKACIVLVDEGAYDRAGAALLHERNEKKPAVIVLLMGHQESETVSENFRLPVRLGHILSRIRYFAETAPLLRDRVIEFGPYQLEAQNRRVVAKSNAEPIKLTEKETALLLFLAEPTQTATRQNILAHVWGYDERIDTHTLETHLYQLRRKLDRDGSEWLIFEQGVYRLAGIPA